MARKAVIQPRSAKAKSNFAHLVDRFHAAIETINAYSEIDMRSLGVDWNSTRLRKSKRSRLEFELENMHYSHEGIRGYIRDGGRNNIILEAFEGTQNIGGAFMSQDYIVDSLSEAVGIASKITIEEGLEFLPPGDSLDRIRGGGESHVRGSDDDDRYRQFVAELLRRGKSIIMGRVNSQFCQYVVVETESELFIAYNKNYGEAPYIVPELELLLLDKRSLLKTGDAIRHRRDQRGDWPQRLREYL